ncbi:helix-turn-helix domain-containing protein [Edaphobacter paludis]|uniref:Helix-turn-helix domain-containing protein n=1 Tax=Edaphobacter paludis TaxID=3035702 RepID=A0AAU7D7Y2_9BACT
MANSNQASAVINLFEPQRVPVYVVLPPRTLLLNVAGPLEVLRRANQEQTKMRFDVSYVAAAAAVNTSIGLTLADLDSLPDELPLTAIIVVIGNVDQVMKDPERFRTSVEDEQEKVIVEWLRRVIRPEHKLITLCSGALLAGRAGLLNHRMCTTHNVDCDELEALAPRAKVLRNRLYVKDGNLYSSAGVTAGVDLMLHVLHELTEIQCVLAVARYLVIHLQRSGSDPQLSPWLEGRNHMHPVVHRVQDAIGSDPTRPWTRAQLAKIAGASGRHLSRLFHEHTGMAIVDYRNRLRVAIAKELLNQSQLDMENIAEKAGFESTRQLRRAWSRVFATSPRQARPPKVNVQRVA